MPSQLTKLITDTRTEGWPSMSNMCQLAIRCHQAGVTIDQVETFLIKQFRKKPSKKENCFFSKHLLQKQLHYTIDQVPKLRIILRRIFWKLLPQSTS